MKDLAIGSIDGLNAHETRYLYDEIFVGRSYLPAGFRLPDNAIVFDVGANIGMYSLFVNAVNPSATIYAFEPLPPIVEKLASNLTAHGVGAKIFACALGDGDRSAEFTYYPGYSIMSAQSSQLAVEADKEFVRRRVRLGSGDDLEEALEFLDEMIDYQFRPVSYVCRIRRMSDVIDSARIPRIDMLKIDVQRAEVDVLAGIDEAHWPMIGQVAVEVHDEPGLTTHHRLPAIIAMLEGRGYRVAVVRDARDETAGRHAVFASRFEAPLST